MPSLDAAGALVGRRCIFAQTLQPLSLDAIVYGNGVVQSCCRLDALCRSERELEGVVDIDRSVEDCVMLNAAPGGMLLHELQLFLERVVRHRVSLK